MRKCDLYAYSDAYILWSVYIGVYILYPDLVHKKIIKFTYFIKYSFKLLTTYIDNCYMWQIIINTIVKCVGTIQLYIFLI